MMSNDDPITQVTKLVQTFRDNFDQYHQTGYKEAQVRKEFIDKLFILLGWDVNNDQGAAEQYKEVINEDAVRIGGKIKAPDYAFRIGGTRIFFVEAKKPSINVKETSEPSFQLRRYAWNSKIPLSVLTNFEDFAIYDCRFKPNPNDSPSVGRLLLIGFEQLVDKFEEIKIILSKESVLKGSFDRYVNASKGKRGTTEVDDEFLKEIDGYREILAKNIVLRNPKLSITEVNYAVQQTINRILFLRICEDRGIESYQELKDVSEKYEVYKWLIELFENADEKYNSGIFDFKTDRITRDLKIDDKILKEIISSLYYPISPYDFSILSVEVLGSVYERFLAKRIELRGSHRITVEEKPEVRKAGGVYYTPEYVVNYIVKSTLGSLIEGKSPKEIETIRILDPACGSGTFLVGAYSYLLDYHLAYYLKNPTRHKKEIYQVKANRWFLSTEIRKKILLNNIFGVDIDPLAVEITKLSLLLKVLENETKESVNQQLKLFRERALPNIDNNIRWGNSLVDSSYFKHTISFTPEEEMSIRPFDWSDGENGFGKIMREGGFDIIIGNPPYVKEYTNREIFEPVKKTPLAKYYQGKMDYWYLFTCHSIDLLKQNGLHSFIAQNNWITSTGASILRNKILKETVIQSFIDFNEFKVFKDAGIQTMVFVLQKKNPPKSYAVNYSKIINKNISIEEITNYLMLGLKAQEIDNFKSRLTSSTLIDKTINFTNSELSGLLDKIQHKANFQLAEDNVAQGIIAPQEYVISSHLEVLKNDEIKKGEGIFVLNKDEVYALKLNQKERSIIKPFYTSIQLSKYYGNPSNQLWLIYSDMSVRKNITEYPHIKTHLEKFEKVITSDFAPYGLHRARDQRFFGGGEKILCLRKTPEPFFTYVNFPCYVTQTYFLIKPEGINLKYLTALLNSKLMYFWLSERGKKQGENLQIDKEPLLGLPIYKPDLKSKKDIELQAKIIANIDGILEISELLANTKLDSDMRIMRKRIKALELQIDEYVSELYGLTEDDFRKITSNNKDLGNTMVLSEK